MFKNALFSISGLLCISLPSFAAEVITQTSNSTQKLMQQNPQAAQTYQDIEKTLGVIPQFVKNYPSVAISGAWEEVKGLLFNPNTAISSKQKSLISFAVDSQIPCQYCSHFDGELSKVNGATTAEMNEAVAIAGNTEHWSTFLNGIQLDEKTFRTEVKQMMKTLRQKASEKPLRQQAGTMPFKLQKKPIGTSNRL